MYALSNEPISRKMIFLCYSAFNVSGQASLNGYATDLEEIRQLAGQIGGSVQFQHVYAHDRDPGNEAADELARQAVMGPSRSRSRNRSRERGRSRSRENNREHIRTHSVQIAGCTTDA